MVVGWIIISFMIKTESKTVDGIRRTKSYVYSHTGAFVQLIEKYEVLATGYMQTTLRNAEFLPVMWYDTNEQLEYFEWEQVLDKKGNPKWESKIIHSTIHNIRGGKKVK